jgi:hypothetical protein
VPVANSLRVISVSVVVAAAVALVWLHAPVVPAITGSVGVGALLYFRGRRATA